MLGRTKGGEVGTNKRLGVNVSCWEAVVLFVLGDGGWGWG